MRENGLEATREAYKGLILKEIGYVNASYEERVSQSWAENDPTVDSPEEVFLDGVIRLIKKLSREPFGGTQGINVISGDLIVERLEEFFRLNSKKDSVVGRLGSDEVYWSCFQEVCTALKNHVRNLRSLQDASSAGDEDEVEEALDRSDESWRTMDSILKMSQYAIKHRSNQEKIKDLTDRLARAHLDLYDFYESGTRGR